MCLYYKEHPREHQKKITHYANMRRQVKPGAKLGYSDVKTPPRLLVIIVYLQRRDNSYSEMPSTFIGNPFILKL